MIIMNDLTMNRIKEIKPKNASIVDFARLILLCAVVDENGVLKTDEDLLLSKINEGRKETK